MSEQGYNGWTNYETWNVALWIDNDQGLQEMVREWASESDDVIDLADQIKDFIEEENPLNDTATMYTDLLNSALSEVNWREIAEHYIDDED